MSESLPIDTGSECANKDWPRPLERLFSVVPLTPPFRRKYARIFGASYRYHDSSKIFEEIDGWSAEWRIKDALEKLWKKTATIDANREVLALVLGVLAVIVSIGIVLAVPAVSVSIVHTDSARGWFPTWVPHISFAILVIFVCLGILILAERLFPSLRAIIAWLIITSMVWAGVAAWAVRFSLNELATSRRIVLATGIIAGLAAVWTTVAMFGIFLAVLGIWQRRIELSMPDVVVVATLLQLLKWHTGHTAAESLGMKKLWVDNLEKGARSLERDIPRKLATGDAETDNWVDSGCSGMATAVRDLKRSVIAPDAETWQSLPNNLKQIAVNVGSGAWGEVPSKEREPIARQSLPLRLLGILRMVAVAALPGLLLWILNQTDLRLEGKAADWAKIAALAWALVSLLIRVDPLLREKLDTLERVASLVRGGERGSSSGRTSP